MSPGGTICNLFVPPMSQKNTTALWKNRKNTSKIIYSLNREELFTVTVDMLEEYLRILCAPGALTYNPLYPLNLNQTD